MCVCVCVVDGCEGGRVNVYVLRLGSVLCACTSSCVLVHILEDVRVYTRPASVCAGACGRGCTRVQQA